MTIKQNNEGEVFSLAQCLGSGEFSIKDHCSNKSAIKILYPELGDQKLSSGIEKKTFSDM